MGENKKILGMSLLLAVLFIAGLVNLFLLRFQSGDIYPAYSSMRSDPLGSRVLYESFSAMPDISVSRHHRSLNHLHFDKDSAVLFLDMPRNFHSAIEEEWKFLTTRLSQLGGQLVISFTPKYARAFRSYGPEDENEPQEKCTEETPTPEVDEAPADAPPSSEPTQHTEETDAEKSWMDLLAVEIGISDHEKPSGSARLNGDAEGLPQELTWRSDLFFTPSADAWHVVYTRDEQPVLIERRFGKGSIILCADTYLFSNEGLLRHRKPGVLTWMMGGSKHIIFDEFHLGITENPGIVSLARKYRLDALFVVGIVLAILILWKDAVPLVPHRTGPGLENIYSASGSTVESLVRLMKSNIDHKSLLSVCLTQWEKTAARDRRVKPETIDTVRKIVASVSPDAKNPGKLIDAYQRICQFLSKQKRRP